MTTPLACCDKPRHEVYDGGRLEGSYVCLHCHESWSAEEYSSLVEQEISEEQREAEHFEYGREELGEVKP